MKAGQGKEDLPARCSVSLVKKSFDVASSHGTKRNIIGGAGN